MLEGQNSQLLAEFPAPQRRVMKQLTSLSALYSSHHSPSAHVVNQCIIIPIVCFLSDRSRKADQVLIFYFGAIPVAFIFQFIF